MGYKKEIKDRELLLSFYVCLFVCSQIAQYQQGHFGLIADCFGLSLKNMSSNQNRGIYRLLYGWAASIVPQHTKESVQITFFDRKCLNQHSKNSSHLLQLRKLC